jgi:hypothetical protein
MAIRWFCGDIISVKIFVNKPLQNIPEQLFFEFLDHLLSQFALQYLARASLG